MAQRDVMSTFLTYLLPIIVTRTAVLLYYRSRLPSQHCGDFDIVFWMSVYTATIALALWWTRKRRASIHRKEYLVYGAIAGIAFATIELYYLM